MPAGRKCKARPIRQNWVPDPETAAQLILKVLCAGRRIRSRNTFLKRDVPHSTSFWNSNVAIVTTWA